MTTEDIVQECLIRFDQAWKAGKAGIGPTGSISFDWGAREYGEFYLLMEKLRGQDEQRYRSLRVTITSRYQGRES